MPGRAHGDVGEAEAARGRQRRPDEKAERGPEHSQAPRRCPPRPGRRAEARTSSGLANAPGLPKDRTTIFARAATCSSDSLLRKAGMKTRPAPESRATPSRMIMMRLAGEVGARGGVVEERGIETVREPAPSLPWQLAQAPL